MQHEFKLTGMHEYMDHLSLGLERKLSRSSWGQQLILPNEIGNGTIHRMVIRPGMEVLLERLSLHQNLRLRIDQECQVLGLVYRLSGESYCEWNNAVCTNLSGPESTVFFTHHTKVYLETSSAIQNNAIKIRMSPGILDAYFADGEENRKLRQMLNAYKNTIRGQAISPAVQAILQAMWTCEYDGALKRLFMESKVLELVTLFIHELPNYDRLSKELTTLRRSDLEKLHNVRRVITEHLDHPLSIRELAKIAGMGTTKLKTGFRTVFDKTIFEYVREQRMQKAAWLLETSRMRVCDVAMVVGYSNPSQFAAAFRKQYGCNPSQYGQHLER